VARRLLEENGLKYREIDAISSEGIDIVLKYNTQQMPSIVDEENKMVFSISEFNRYLEMINKEY
jgi:glutaredoxin